MRVVSHVSVVICKFVLFSPSILDVRSTEFRLILTTGLWGSVDAATDDGAAANAAGVGFKPDDMAAPVADGLTFFARGITLALATCFAKGMALALATAVVVLIARGT